MVKVISSAANPVAKEFRALSARKQRRESGRFLVEGVQPVWQAVESGVQLDAMLVAPQSLGEGPSTRLIDEQRAAGVRVVECTAELLARLSGPRRATGLAAIARRSEATLDDLTVSPDSVFVVLHMPRNPGNVGGIIRTAVSAGAHGVLVIGSSADPYAPESVRASMGAIFGIPVVELAEVEEFFDWAAAHEVQTVGTSPTAHQTHWEASYPLPSAVVVGNEQHGLPSDVLARVQRQVRIPMLGTAESLNAAVAAAIILYEMRRPATHPGTDQ